MMAYLMKPANWWFPLLIIFTISIAGVIQIGRQTYNHAPPIPDYVTQQGQILFSHNMVLSG